MAVLSDKFKFLRKLQHVTRHADEARNIHIENCVGFVPVPVGIADPLRIQGINTPKDTFHALLASSEAALVASVSRGCKAFDQCGRMQFEVLEELMSRLPPSLYLSKSE